MPSSADVRFYDDRVLIKLGIATAKNNSVHFTSLCLAKCTNHIYLCSDLFHSEFMTKLSFSLPLFDSKKILIFSFDTKKSFFQVTKTRVTLMKTSLCPMGFDNNQFNVCAFPCLMWTNICLIIKTFKGSRLFIQSVNNFFE